MLPWEINLMPCFSVKINGSQFGKFVIFRGIIHNQAYSEAKKSRRNQLRSMTSDWIMCWYPEVIKLPMVDIKACMGQLANVYTYYIC